MRPDGMQLKNEFPSSQCRVMQRMFVMGMRQVL